MKWKKGFFILFILMFMLIALMGCQSQSSVQEKEEQKSETNTKTITVATSADFPPFEYHEVIEGKDTITGFDIELIQEIGKKLGMKIKIEDMSFDGVIPAVESGKVDLGISGISYKEERAKKVDFSDPYYYSAQTILVKKDAKEIKTMNELKGKVVGSQLATTSDDIISSFDGIQIKKYKKVNDAILDLNNDRIDAVIVEDAIASEFIKDYKELKIVIPDGLNTEKVPMVIAFPKGEEKLVHDVNEVLQMLKDSGKLNQLIEKYGLVSIQK
ncbi:basic amino acid ABC transporter substrate-binding protein [Garciella nitratireducens]|uniref:Polar amino acid transport system substrate-binding protein n=1 Tax=Garciella nitratireducens DSM 15102 TaxID=1121911 RepID=A0A1T4LLB8_9FIRM|nr:basic amino acid ABC transporter substrate-binding protein [Garciella nitratireducens]SJZ55441.1 polar amino acid transport system substrate-binding protein [Garciella nitratireducens DSM 15102]